jgi:hypothetical protein
VLPVGSYQTAWTMLAKLRAAMSSADKDRLSGVVEVDEWLRATRRVVGIPRAAGIDSKGGRWA